MARIKIKDLPREIKISKEEMKKTFGGLSIRFNQISPFIKTNIRESLSTKRIEDGIRF